MNWTRVAEAGFGNVGHYVTKQGRAGACAGGGLVTSGGTYLHAQNQNRNQTPG